LKKLALALGLKIGDVPNMADKVKEALPDLPSATSGGVFRVGNIVSNFTIQDIVANKAMTVISTGMGVGVVAGEGGVIIFDRPHVIANQVKGRVPWGLYTSLGTAELAAEIGGMVYFISNVQMKGILEKEVLDLSI
jgi:hypothetical protein